MARIRTRRLGDLQLKIMKALWERGEASVPDVHGAVGRGERLAYTTIATMLRKMEARGLVRHRVEERRFIYRAAVSAEDITRGMAHDIVDRLFEGSLADMVSHLLQTREVSREELERIQQLVAQAKKRS